MPILSSLTSPRPQANAVSAASPTTASWENARLGRLVLLLVLLGVAWRLVRYFLRFPIWGDEAHIALNLLDRDYWGLTQPLRFVQAAPLLFLWAERAVYDLFGGSELAIRLPALIGGLAGLLLFWRLSRQLLPSLGGAFAVGILAVAYYPVRHSSEVKPYGVDLGVAVLLLWLAVSWLRQPERRGWLVALVFTMPLAVGLSYPAVFLGGTISLVLLPAVWRGDAKMRALYLAYNLVMLASFGGFYWLAGVGQHASQGGPGNVFFMDYFPPAQPGHLLLWLLDVHTGAMLAYPVGGPRGGSTATALLCLLGLAALVRGRRWQLLALCLGPFALTFVAAVLHRYPYGGSARYEQHLAPAICLLMGSGLALVLEGLARSERARHGGTLGTLAVLAALGVAGLVGNILKPYKTLGDYQVRQVLRDIQAQAGPDDQIVIMDPPPWMGPTFEWYLRQPDDRIRWDGQIDWEQARRRSTQVWGLFFLPGYPRAARLETELNRQSEQPWVRLERVEHRLQQGATAYTIEYCELYHWKRLPSDPQDKLPRGSETPITEVKFSGR